jgi:hypothetical protein
VYANSAFSQANTATIIASSSFTQANLAIQQGGVITGGYANSAFARANSALSAANASALSADNALSTANLGVNNASIANQRAVTSGVYANSAFTVANSAFFSAGNALPRSGGVMTGTLTMNADINASGRTITAGLFQGTATTARYADLAEKYTTDQEYAIGTVVVVSTDENFEATQSFDTAQVVLGVISEKPAYLMNEGSDGQAIALRGRVPVKVIGPVNKGQTLISSNDGYAIMGTGENKFAIALESIGNEEGLIEAVIL